MENTETHEILSIHQDGSITTIKPQLASENTLRKNSTLLTKHIMNYLWSIHHYHAGQP